MNVVGTILYEDGTHMDIPKEMLQILLSIHFMGSHTIQSTSQNKTKVARQAHWTSREDWSIAKSVLKYSGIKWILK